MSDWVYCLLGIVGGSLLSFIISWFFSGRYNLVADIVTVPSEKSRFSEKADIDNKKGFAAYDTYVVLKNNGNQGLQMSDFAPLNMPHILINGGVLQEREKPYRTLKNPNPFAMYNNVQLSYDGKWTINITFDQLKAGHTIEIVVHSLFPKNQQKRVKLAVGATLKNGNYISKKQLRAIYGNSHSNWVDGSDGGTCDFSIGKISHYNRDGHMVAGISMAGGRDQLL